jgi:hypothetical protein
MQKRMQSHYEAVEGMLDCSVPHIPGKQAPKEILHVDGLADMLEMRFTKVLHNTRNDTAQHLLSETATHGRQLITWCRSCIWWRVKQHVLDDNTTPDSAPMLLQQPALQQFQLCPEQAAMRGGRATTW